MKKVFTIIVVILLTISITGCKKKEKEPVKKEEVNKDNVTITLGEYEQLKVGMSYDEVTKIIGGNCNKVKDNEYYCSGDYAGTSATLIFENDRLKDKKQTGL